jgi:hypothetical protein
MKTTPCGPTAFGQGRLTTPADGDERSVGDYQDRRGRLVSGEAGSCFATTPVVRSVADQRADRTVNRDNSCGCGLRDGRNKTIVFSGRIRAEELARGIIRNSRLAGDQMLFLFCSRHASADGGATLVERAMDLVMEWTPRDYLVARAQIARGLAYPLPDSFEDIIRAKHAAAIAQHRQGSPDVGWGRQ